MVKLITNTPILTSIIESIKYVHQLVGAEHVALGSDFDGAVVVRNLKMNLMQRALTLEQF